MGCAGCRKLHGLAALYGADAGKYPLFLRCLVARIGRPEGASWDAAAHAALYAEASSVINFRGDAAPEDMRLEAFGSNPDRAGQIAGNLPTMKFEADDRFWTCLGVDRASAVASMTARSGVYWNQATVTASIVAALEGGRRKPRGSLLAAVLTLAGGSAAAFWAGGR